MNQLQTSAHLAAGEAVQARFARSIVAALDERVDALDSAVTARLRFARTRALERAERVRVEAASQRLGSNAQGAAVLGGGTGWWVKLGSWAPLLALVCGLLLIQSAENRAQVSVAAEVDAALLSDDLPPRAYTDPAFGEFLKLPPSQ